VNWVTIIWSMTAAASLTLAGVHGFVWLRRRQQMASLMFCIMAAATAGMAGCELWTMQQTDMVAYTHALQWYNVMRWLVTLALVGFIHFYLGSGRPWLEWTVCGMRTLSLLVNFLFSPMVYYTSIEQWVRIKFLGTEVTVVEGIPSPFSIIGQLSLLVLA
jgi:hypothetical protein